MRYSVYGANGGKITKSTLNYKISRIGKTILSKKSKARSTTTRDFQTELE